MLKFLSLGLSVAILGCSDGAGRAGPGGPVAALGSADAGVSSSQVQADDSCPGFRLVGAKYSPGGTVLPHTCKPFDPVTNNPYAVRCVDAMPRYLTPYPGDEYCILPPPPDQGVQVGVHPQGTAYWSKMWVGDFSDYANSAETKPYEVAPGVEIVQDYGTTATNDQKHFFFRLDTRMRTGSHHIASYVQSQALQEGWGASGTDSLLFANGSTVRVFYNLQRQYADRPSSLVLAPEDEGLGMPFDSHQAVNMQLHHINPLNKPILREVWINVWWTPDAQVTKPIVNSLADAPINYPPNSVLDNGGAMTATGDTRLLEIFGHRHAWTTHFSIWITRTDGSTESVYDSFNWEETPTFDFDTVTKNPVANAGTQTDGATSGLVMLHAGDKLNYNCHVDTTARRAQQLGVPPPTTNLAFANEAYKAEMCIPYAQTVGPAMQGSIPGM